jgi:hypothetical protein
MPNNNENTKACIKFSAKTSKLEKGEVVTELVVLENVPTPLFVLFVYEEGFNSALLRAAKLKKKRLKFKYRDAKVEIIDGFKFPHEFKAEWTNLYNKLTNPETACKYALWQIHYFGHGGHNCLYFKKYYGNDKIHFDAQDNMERLPWHPNEGIFVLHSCRGAAYEDNVEVEKIKDQICLANTISAQQKTRCLGQVTYTNNNFLDLIDYPINDNNVAKPLAGRVTILYSKEKWETDVISAVKYRANPYYNLLNKHFMKPVVLWGYALLTGKTKTKVLKLKNSYENNDDIQNSTLPKLYPIYQEIEKLSSKNQIFPCRVFNNGMLEPRIVEVDVFNQNDLEYL